MLWVLIRIASTGTHNKGFYGEQQKKYLLIILKYPTYLFHCVHRDLQFCPADLQPIYSCVIVDHLKGTPSAVTQFPEKLQNPFVTFMGIFCFQSYFI